MRRESRSLPRWCRCCFITAAAKPVVCRARDLVPMAGGATHAAAVATWVLVRARVDVLVGVAALRRRVARRFRMRSRLVNSVGMVVGLSVGVASLCILGTGGCCASMERVIRWLSMLLLVGPVVGLLVVGPSVAVACTLGTVACTLGTRCVLGVLYDGASSARRSGCACTWACVASMMRWRSWAA